MTANFPYICLSVKRNEIFKQQKSKERNSKVTL